MSKKIPDSGQYPCLMASDSSSTSSRFAFIPARGGSKRIPRKNIRDFAGQPIIFWPIRAAIDSHSFHSVIVSTDDPEIAEISASFGAEVIFRDAGLSDDFTHTTAVLQDGIVRVIDPEENPWVYKIYPTTPATPRELQDFVAFTELEPSGLSVSVTRSRDPIQRALLMNSDEVLHFREPEYALTRTQDLEPVYFDAGKIYGGRKSDWLETQTPLLSSPRGFELPEWLSVDMDTVEDWELAEYKFRRKFGVN
jgi:pseudaminic acid cytidylyltransferase